MTTILDITYDYRKGYEDGQRIMRERAYRKIKTQDHIVDVNAVKWAAESVRNLGIDEPTEEALEWLTR